MADRKWFADHLPADGSAQLVDVTTGLVHARAVGPARARHPGRASTSDDVSHEGFPFGTCRTIEVGTAARARLADLLRRRPRLGALRPDRAGRRGCGTRSGRPAQPHGVVPVGIGVYGTTGRLEKGYRAYGFELESEYNVVEAGMAGPRVKDEDFVGKEAYLRHREAEPAADPLHADRRRPHLGDRRQALHARPRADPHPRRRAADRRAGPPLVRDQRRLRRPRSASTS